MRWPTIGMQIILALVCIGFLATVGPLVLYPYQISFVEGYLVEQGERMAAGGSFYRDIAEPPFLIDNFPPFYILILAVGVWLGFPGFLFGRILTVAAVAYLAVLLYRYAARSYGRNHIEPVMNGEGEDEGAENGGAENRGGEDEGAEKREKDDEGERGYRPELAVAAGITALWLLSPVVVNRSILVRMDFAAIIFSTLGVLWYSRHYDRQKKAVVGALVFFYLAAMTRQTAIAGIAGIIAVLLFERQYRRAAVLGGSFAALGLVTLVVLQLLTGGEFWLHVVVYNRQPILLDKLAELWGEVLLVHMPLLVLSLFGMFQAIREEGRDRFVKGWWVFALLMSITAAGPGSDINHFLEILFVSALMGPSGVIFLSRLWKERKLWLNAARPRWLTTHALVVTLLVVVLMVQTLVTVEARFVERVADVEDNREMEEALVRLLEETEGPVLCENAGAVVLSGHELVIEPWTLNEMDRRGLWDEDILLADIENQVFTLIVLEDWSGSRWSERTLETIEAHYDHNESIGKYDIWWPT